MLLDQQSKLSRFCLDQASFSFFRQGEDGRFLYANPRALESLGYSLDELLNMSVPDIDPTISKEKWPEIWQMMCDHESITLEAVHRRKDGTTFPVEVTANLLDFEGSRFGCSYVQDITERKRVEEALRLTQFSFDKASIGIFQSNMKAQILNVNDEACRSLGYTREELCAMEIFDIDPTVTREHWNELWQKIYEYQGDTFESVHLHKNGTQFPVEISSNRLEFNGEMVSISFVRDITAKKNNALQREKMEAHIRQAQRMDSLGTLAGGIAHDFNNILSAIIGYTELIQMGCQDNPKLQNYTSQLCVAGVRAKNLVKQILTFSRQGDSEKVPLDISRVINEALDLIRATVPSSIEILNAVKPNQGVVLANETQIHQIIMNLCTNAHHAMEEEGGLLEVDLVPTVVGPHDTLNHAYPVSTGW